MTMLRIAFAAALSLSMCSQVAASAISAETSSSAIVQNVEIHAEGATLAATLTIPGGQGPFPAAILLSVAGPNDRDQSVGPHRGYRNLAQYLAQHGIASIRMDDRGAGESGGDYFAASWETLAGDAAAAHDLLCGYPEIECNRIGYIGMSQGGAVGAMASRLRPDSAFVVLLSAPGLDGIAALHSQLEATIRLQNIDETTANGFRALFDQYVGIVSHDAADRRERLLAFLEGPGRALIPPYGFVPRENDALADMLLGAWYQSNLSFDPAEVYGQLDVPVLAIGGTRDPVAPPTSHLARIQGILDAAPASDVTIETLENGNHLLQVSETGLPGEYATLEHAIAPEILQLISRWIVERTED